MSDFLNQITITFYNETENTNYDVMAKFSIIQLESEITMSIFSMDQTEKC